MSIITLSGLDGSGKSTQIELLKDYLESQDKTFFYFHAVEFSIGNKILGKKKDKSGKEVSVEKAGWLKIFLRKIALLIDVFRFRRLIKKKKVDYIISDRYFYDNVVNIEYLDRRHRMSRMLAEKYIPQPDHAFIISVDPKNIMQRDLKPDQGMEYLIAKERLFSAKIKKWNMIVIDGERKKAEIFEEIKSNIHV